jgi:hypothetical protein
MCLRALPLPVPDNSFSVFGFKMPQNAQSVLNDFVGWLVGRKVREASLFLNSLRVCVECEFGEKAGLFIYFDPVWHIGSPRGVLVGSRQAQTEERDAHAALNLLVQELLGKRVESVTVDSITGDIDVRLSSGFWVRTFVADPTDEESWYIRDKKEELTVAGSANGLQLRSHVERRPDGSDENSP